MTSRSILCHLQIAKAASNTIRKVMQNSFSSNDLEIVKITNRSYNALPVTVYSEHPKVKEGVSRIVSRQFEIRAISMMLSFGIHEFLERKVAYFTFVRDPVKRALSALHFVYSNRRTHPAAPFFESVDYRPSALIEQGEILFTNDQVRIISGTKHSNICDQDLEKAKDNIRRHFVFAGNSDFLSACWPTLSQATGLPNVEPHVLNKGIYTDNLQICDAEIKVIREANIWDAKLLEWVNTSYLPELGIRFR